MSVGWGSEGHRVAREEPRGVTAGPGRRRLQHDLADSGYFVRRALVPGMDADPAEGSHVDRVDDAEDAVSFGNAEPSLERGGRLRQSSGLQLQKTAQGLEDVQGPVLPVLGGAGDARVGSGTGFAEPI